MTMMRKSMILVSVVVAVIGFLFFQDIETTSSAKVFQDAYPIPTDVGRLKNYSENYSIAAAYPPPPTIIGEVDEDSVACASVMGGSVTEVEQRLIYENAAGKIQANLLNKESDTFAGLWIEQQPVFKVVIQSIKGESGKLKTYFIGDAIEPFVEIREVDLSLKELQRQQKLVMKNAKAIGISLDSEINLEENLIVLYILDQSQIDAAIRDKKLSLPSKVKIVKVKKLSEDVSGSIIHGGLELQYFISPTIFIPCTSGFSVVTYGKMGITTAGHCGNSQQYQGEMLQFIDEIDIGNYDIQWHSIDSEQFFVPNIIYTTDIPNNDADRNWRFINYVKYSDQQTQGSCVCKYGIATGYNCGLIVTTNYNYEHNVRVDIPVSGGDSGGPWFRGKFAYGTTISAITDELGGNVYGSVYGPIDQIEDLMLIPRVMTGQLYLPIIKK